MRFLDTTKQHLRFPTNHHHPGPQPVAAFLQKPVTRGLHLDLPGGRVQPVGPLGSRIPQPGTGGVDVSPSKNGGFFKPVMFFFSGNVK